MEIKPDPLKAVSTDQSKLQIKAVEEQLDQLSERIASYSSLFKEMFAHPEQLHHPDFVPLELCGHELEVQAMRARSAVAELAKSDLNQAQQLKDRYDNELGELHKEISGIIENALPALRKEIDIKYKELTAKQSMNPSAFLELQNKVQQFQLLLEKSEQELRRIQFQRLFD